MANVTLWGDDYTDVPAITVPKTGGGTVTFYENGGGGTPAISVVDTTDSGGGTIRTITALDISDTTAVASDVASGKYFYTAAGVKTAGTGSGGGGSGLTQHTIHLEFTDSTDTDIEVDYDDALIGTMITAYEPTTYGGKTVTLAQLDGVTWYQYTPGTWETLFNGTTSLNQESPYPSWWIESLASILIPLNSTWRVTINNGMAHTLIATYNDASYGPVIGNPLYIGGPDDGSGVTFCFMHTAWGAWSGCADMTPGNYTVKIERLTS